MTGSLGSISFGKLNLTVEGLHTSLIETGHTRHCSIYPGTTRPTTTTVVPISSFSRVLLLHQHPPYHHMNCLQSLNCSDWFEPLLSPPLLSSPLLSSPLLSSPLLSSPLLSSLLSSPLSSPLLSSPLLVPATLLISLSNSKLFIFFLEQQ